MVFINRAAELTLLGDRWQAGRPELLVVYGRRRVGKSELLLQWAQDKPHLYLLGDLRSERDHLATVTDRLSEYTGDPLLSGNPISSWSVVLDYLNRLAAGARLLVILDEFQYFAESTPALPSLIQSAWDQRGRFTQIMLVLCGSYVSFMERETLSYQSPLYGRRTGQLHLQPLGYLDAGQFFPKYSLEDRVLAYAILGGMPFYLSAFDPTKELAANIRSKILEPASVLYSEARLLLMEELREPRNYFSLLRAISFGKTRLNEIAQEAGLTSGVASKYLDVLQGLGLVDRQLPVTERRPERSRQGIYRITDNYLAFWFRFVLPNVARVQEGDADRVVAERIQPFLTQFAGRRFEEVCMQFVRRHRGTGPLAVDFDRVGGWWAGGEEIDIIAVNEERVVLVGECKWTTEWMKIGDLNDLRRRAALAGFQEPVVYTLFSRSGFDPNLRELAQAEGIRLFGLEELFA